MRIRLLPPAARAGCLFLAALGLALLLAAPGLAQSEGQRVLVATVDGPITPPVAEHLKDAVTTAQQGEYHALVIRLDTPGGLDTSMRLIVQQILSAEVPVVVYVHPQGARAASAGAIITISAHVAAMAPGSAIGAATPVELEGGDLEAKIVNDAAAYAESLAELRGRNVEFAIDTVREGRSASASEALELGAIDLVSGSLPELLRDMDGRQVQVGGDERPVTLETASAAIDEFEPTLFRRIQLFLADPNVAFLFVSLGSLLIIYEVANPGLGLGGAVGVMLLILAMFSLSVLPVSAVGVVLLLLAAILFIAEIFAPGIGVAAGAGTLALLLSGVFLIRDVPGLEVSMAVITPVALVVGLSVFFAGRLAVRAQRGPSTSTGYGRYVGMTGVARAASGGRYQAQVDGAWWNISGRGFALADGMRVRVVGNEGLELVVEPVEAEPAEAEQAADSIKSSTDAPEGDS